MTTSRLLLLAASASLLAAPAHAQQRDLKAAPLAWVGCWEPMDALPGSGMTCVVPSTDLRTLRVLEVAGNDVKEVSRLVLDGERHAVTASGCEGWERARLSSDGGRILLDAEVSCAGLPKQTRSGAFVITPRGDWLQVQGSGFDAVSNARVRLFRETVALTELPMEVRAGLSPVLGLAEATRADVARQKLAASDLVELASMKVAAPVIDVIVAAGFPKAFMLDPAGSAEIGAAPQEARAQSLVLSPGYYGFGYPSLYLQSGMNRMCDLNLWSMFDYFYCVRTRTSQWNRYGYGGFDGFGSGWIPGYGYGGGVVVVVRPTDPTPRESGGRVVRGQGYTQGGSASSGGGSTAQPRTRATAADASSAGSSSSSGGSSSASSGSSSGSSSSERTAQPRKP